MDWIPALVIAIGSIRLVLIFSGILMLLRCIFKLRGFSEHQKRCFAISGIIYLLGLMPQSLLLLFTNSETVNYLLDSGYLCWIQKFACIVAVSIHGSLFLTCIYVTISSINKLNAFAKRKDYFSVLVIYITLLAISRIFFLQVDDSQNFHMNSSNIDNATYMEWTSVQYPTQTVQLQLLLCESSLSASDMKYFLTLGYLFLFLPLVLMFLILKTVLTKVQQSTDVYKICDLDSTEGWQHHSWWKQEVNNQKILSTLITFWYFVLQPIVFAFQREHFVDFGTHLLLTISVFIPWTLTSAEQKGVQIWV